MKVFTVLCVFVASFAASAQSFSWVRQFETTTISEGRSIHFSSLGASKGYLLSTGSFQGTIDLDPTSQSKLSTSNGANDVYISKLNLDGSFGWGKTLGGVGDDVANCIYQNELGEIYIAGYFSSSVDFDPGAGIFTLTSAGNVDAFILKLDFYGDFVWARQFEGIGLQTITSLTCDHFNNVYATGIFTGATDFDPGTGTSILTETGGQGNTFISKLNPSGNFVWIKEIGTNGSSLEAGNSICVKYSNILVSGYFDGTIDLDPGLATSLSTTNGGYDIYISKLDLNGNFIWGKTIGGSSNDESKCVKIDRTSNVYVSGYFGGTVDFDPGAATHTLSAAGGNDAFISKLNATGNFVWAKEMGSTNSDSGNGISFDDRGGVYIAGSFMGTADFNPGTGTPFNLVSAGSDDAFIATFDTTGTFLSAKALGGAASDYCNDIVVDGAGLIYTTGAFNGIADFDPDATSFYLSPMNTRDVFVHKMCNLMIKAGASHNVICAGQTTTLSIDGSGVFNWAPSISVISNTLVAGPVATTVYTLTGSFNGCSDTDTLRITVNPLPGIAASASSSLICSGSIALLTASVAPGVNYIWNTGATTASIFVSPTVTTTYSVTGTNSCGTVTVTVVQNVADCTGIEEELSTGNILMYPNPANDYVQIAVPANLAYANAVIEITDALGKVVMKENVSGGMTMIRTSKLEDGIYFFKVSIDNRILAVSKVMIQ